MIGHGDHRNARTITLLTTIAVVIIGMGGCGAAQQANRWVDPSQEAAPLKKVLVIGMRPDPLAPRRAMADAPATAEGHDFRPPTAAPIPTEL